MSIQALLNKGQVEGGAFEKVADGILALPRALWQGKTVTVIKDAKTGVIKDFEAKNANNLTSKLFVSFRNWGTLLISIFVAMGYGVLCVAASPLLAAGLLVKKISLANDDKARNYSTIVEKKLHIEDLRAKKDALPSIYPELKTKKVAKIEQEIANDQKSIEALLPNIRDENRDL